MKFIIKSITLLFFIVLFSSQYVIGQEIRWINPEKNDNISIQGKLWPDSLIDKYSRLPFIAKELVRPKIWELSKNTAGLYIAFTSNSSVINFRYSVKGNLALKHMSLIGVSGVDLYALTNDNEWEWARGNYKKLGSDTMLLSFDTLDFNKVKEYRLYLPLYNTLNWFEIGVDSESNFKSKNIDKKNIVVYGTSIAQGASASRAGMAWTAILNRKLDIPIINLGFSANGRLEPEIIELISNQETSVFILDCLPNLTVYSSKELKEKLLRSVEIIRKKHAETPIIFTEHSDATISLINKNKQEPFLQINQQMKSIFNGLQLKGIKNIYLLTAEDIGLDINSTVDGVHPSDLGMVKYANAYEKFIKKILSDFDLKK